jgi:cysteine desulfurase/selenocysteine lyase
VALPLVPRDEPVYPESAAPSPAAAGEELADVFDFLDDWAERYQYIIELGQKLPSLPLELKTEANRVHGCQSRVWMVARVRREGSENVIDFIADSDSAIVKGLIAILQRVYSGQPAGDILDFDVEKLLERLGLDQHLTLGRRNGLHEMVQRIKRLAAAHAQGPRTAALAAG